MKPMAVGKHLVIDPRICLGRLSFRGTRLPVATVLAPLLEGRTVKEVLAAWPELTRPAVVEAVKLAAASWPQLLPDEADDRLMRLAASLARLPPDADEPESRPTQYGLFKRAVKIGEHLIIDPRVCRGMLTVKRTRVPAEAILYALSHGRGIEGVLEGWPYLKREAIEETIRLAAAAWPELMSPKVAREIRHLAGDLQGRDGQEPR